MGLLDGVKKVSIAKKETDSIVNILPTVVLKNTDSYTPEPEFTYDSEQPPSEKPADLDDPIETEADMKREIALAMVEADKVDKAEKKSAPKKRGRPKKAAKKSTKKTTKKATKKITIRKPPTKEEKPAPTKALLKKAIKPKKELPPDEDIPPVNPTINAKPVEIVPYVNPTPQVIPIQQSFPSIEELRFMMERRNMLKNELIDPETDFMMIRGKKFMLKSGWRKFIEGFRISIDIISVKVYKFGNDIVAEYRVKVVTPFGQFAVADGTKSKSEYWSDKYQNYGSYNLHNLKATARTRAINIAVSDLVGHGEVSAEEVETAEELMIVEQTNFFKT